MLVQSSNRRVPPDRVHASGAGGPSCDPGPQSARVAVGRFAPIDSAYIYQMAWMARVLATSPPKRHVDISTSACFAAVAAAFVPVELCCPLSPAPILPGVRTRTVDPTDLPFRDASVESVSCSAEVQSMTELDAELKRILAPDGSLLYVRPLGKPSAVQGPRRVYTFGEVLDGFEGLDLEEFSLIPNDGAPNGLLINPDPRLADRQHRGLGCFWFRKPIHS